MIRPLLAALTLISTALTTNGVAAQGWQPYPAYPQPHFQQRYPTQPFAGQPPMPYPAPAVAAPYYVPAPLAYPPRPWPPMQPVIPPHMQPYYAPYPPARQIMPAPARPAYPSVPSAPPLSEQRAEPPAEPQAKPQVSPPALPKPQTPVAAKPVQPKISTLEPTTQSAPNSAASSNTKPTVKSKDRKADFVSKLLPYISRENQRLQQLRERLVELFAQIESSQTISDKDQQDLTRLAKRYRIKSNPIEDAGARAELLNRVDVIPASLALAQAANESGWGRSRFATEANNLFGIWTYDKSKGLKPLDRDEDKDHLVRKFDDFGESIAYYMRMLNSHPAYRDLRDIRLRARSQGHHPSGLELAEGLEKYSAKGKVYIELIQQLIEQNQWTDLDLPDPAA